MEVVPNYFTGGLTHNAQWASGILHAHNEQRILPIKLYRPNTESDQSELNVT